MDAYLNKIEPWTTHNYNSHKTSLLSFDIEEGEVTDSPSFSLTHKFLENHTVEVKVDERGRLKPLIKLIKVGQTISTEDEIIEFSIDYDMKEGKKYLYRKFGKDVDASAWEKEYIAHNKLLYEGISNIIPLINAFRHDDTTGSILGLSSPQERGTLLGLYDCNLRKLLFLKQRLSFKNKYHIFKEILRAVASLHEKKLVHGKLAPETIFIDKKADQITSVQLTDFGAVSSFAKRAIDAPAVSRYCSPEATKARLGPNDPSLAHLPTLNPFGVAQHLDPWSVGVIALEMGPTDSQIVDSLSSGNELINRLLDNILDVYAWQSKPDHALTQEEKYLKATRQLLQWHAEDRWTAKQALDLLEG